MRFLQRYSKTRKCQELSMSLALWSKSGNFASMMNMYKEIPNRFLQKTIQVIMKKPRIFLNALTISD